MVLSDMQLKGLIHLVWLYRIVSCIGLMCKSQHRLLKRLPSQTETVPHRVWPFISDWNCDSDHQSSLHY